MKAKMDINELIEKRVASFKANYCKRLNGDSINTDINVAVELAYSDAKRTMTNIGTEDNTIRKEHALKDINAAFIEYFSKAAPKSYAEFDSKHNELCEIWTNIFKNTDLGSYGKAQKIVNMSFKYLYCFYHTDSNFEAHFKYCHMPLDSFTLEWFKRKSLDRITIGKLDSWSKLQTGFSPDSHHTNEKNGKYTYEFYRDEIRNISDEKKCSPLEIEFVVWPETQLLLATEAYLYVLKPEWKSKKEDARKMPLSEKTKEIVNLIQENNLEINETYWF